MSWGVVKSAEKNKEGELPLMELTDAAPCEEYFKRVGIPIDPYGDQTFSGDTLQLLCDCTTTVFPITDHRQKSLIFR